MSNIERSIYCLIAFTCFCLGYVLTNTAWEKDAVSKGFGKYVEGKFYWTREKVYVEESVYKMIKKDREGKDYE